ncbi:MAG: DUF5107 domain-containing protein [Candidatus Marinimicrobia bacterium]|nr:DUF5107 domain-containing protein [Candidatus Neomarinimicrobiota bacterium]MDP6610701.1 DUF5107 domain-containing protein [Candidatus Neomarinimicrobiota bacterium]|tara:strand:+ start:2030 stop:4954 length:2925 start_codon:yes stop_codon:yes gene_type:complete
MKKYYFITILLCLQFSCDTNPVTITEEVHSIKTYPFSEPNPIPILTKDERLYPYHQFMGYSHDGKAQDWKVIKMENDHIEVYVLPEVGGKVWGAIDKANGEEFIYRNEVIKFRNIALRGPWTSGGIEFNFGVIGHTPATATAVDYTTRTNPDGSVSTFVGGMDLPSRTHWRVEIKVEPGRANFETNALWYNPTPSTQAYYNWMTAAAFAQDDLEMVFPGDRYLKHSGAVHPWPIDGSGRNLTYYDNNRFEGHKSYHVVGAWKNFFGGYYHKDGYGFGHWARQDEMPGQKLWLWALSRQGGIWEDLLTDTDGQYIEFQAGRQMVQYSPGDHENPVRKAGFDPYGTDRWTEAWFPMGPLGGLVDASRDGAMNVEMDGGEIHINLHSFIQAEGDVEIRSNGQVFHHQSISFQPREVHSIQVAHEGPFEVIVDVLGLHFNSDLDAQKLGRSYETDPAVVDAIDEADWQSFQAYEFLKERRYDEAGKLFTSVMKRNSHHLAVNRGMADLNYRKGKYRKGLSAIKKILAVNGYDAEANFIAGNIYRAKGMYHDAREAFGWAARSLAFRSAAYTQMAEISLIERQYSLAVEYANQALDFNRYNINAYQVKAIAYRKLENKKGTSETLNQLLGIDPLHHFANLERYFLNPSGNNWDRYSNFIQNEYPDQIHLELAISYHNRGLNEEAITLLKNAVEMHENPLIYLWIAYLEMDGEVLVQANEISSEFVFPFRRETIRALEWAVENNDSWKWKYYLALNYWGKNRDREAMALMNSLEDNPDYAPFYIARASLKEKLNLSEVKKDLSRSIALNSDSWRVNMNAVQFYQKNNNWNEAYRLSSNAFERFPENFNVEIMHARSLLYTEQWDESIAVLKSVQVLPSEMARESRQLFEWALIRKSLDLIKTGKIEKAISAIEKSKEWPENLGVGKPYDPDEGLQNILLDYCKDSAKSENYIKLLKAMKKGNSGKDYKTILINKALAVIE